MVERILAPYKISQRTEYSKIIVTLIDTDEAVSKIDKTFTDEILNTYDKQTKNSSKYFIIKGDVLECLETFVYDDKIPVLFVPNEITEIKCGVFKDLYINYVSLPDSLKIISSEAFFNCTELLDIYIPDSVEIIKRDAFYGCTNLESVRLPNGLKHIQEGTFYNCERLRKINLPDSIEVIDEYAFAFCKFESIKLPESLSIISGHAFEDCKELSSVVFPKSLIRVSPFAFHNCCKLKKIKLQENTIELGCGIFSGCSSIESVVLPKKLKTLPGQTFANCRSLKNIVLPDNIKFIGKFAFENTTNLQTINIPKNLKSIGNCPFANSGVQTLIFKHDLTNLIVESAEKNVDLISGSNIVKLVIDNSVTKITPDAFKYSGKNIKSIEYLGTEKEFDKFKENNEGLFKLFKNLLVINFNEEKINCDIGMEER